MITRNVGFNKVEIRWRHKYAADKYRLYRSNCDSKAELIAETKDNVYIDTVPINLNQQRYAYTLKAIGDNPFLVDEKIETCKKDFCEDFLPMPYLPKRNGWMQVYKKAWQLAWKSIVTSENLPNRHSYCDYPDSNTVYVWDACFFSMFQRYAALQGIHPCMNSLDNFYAVQQDDGYIARCFRYTTFESRDDWEIFRDKPSAVGTNPPLFAWAEWEYYLVSADRRRLKKVLPKLMLHYGFIESFFQEEPGYYQWDAGGSGWDNINKKQGKDEIYWYVDLFSQQAVATKYIAKIADELGEVDTRDKFQVFRQEKRQLLDEIHWNKEKNWYCSLTKDNRFTRKTLSGVWPFIAGIVDSEKADNIVRDVLMNPEMFFTEAMPLPTVAKDEPGYNPKGEYWLGGVWMFTSLMTLKGLHESGFDSQAFELSMRTLDGMAKVYNEYEDFPNALWECYAPEAAAPASHKTIRPDNIGGVREYTNIACDIITILIENVLGFYVNAPENSLTWQVRLDEEHGIDRLRFGDIHTDLRIEARANIQSEAQISVSSNKSYTLHVKVAGNGMTPKNCTIEN